ncbi:MAG: hypothetical protein ACW964_09475 [Candidatus Hodarchaeales archaeon]|jgi:hypothetical protein
MGRLKRFYFIIISILILSSGFLPSLAQENEHNEYFLIVYYEGDRNNTGDLVTLKAELFLEGTRLADPKNVRIEGSNQIPPPNSMEFTLEHEEKGIFTYIFTIPNITGIYELPIHFNAYIEDEFVASHSITIPIENQLSTLMNLRRIFHTFSHQVVKPNETIRITSYIPEVENGTIDYTEVNITTEVWIKYPQKEVNETASQFHSEYHDNGYFHGSYTIPMIIANRSLRMTNALDVKFIIRTMIQNNEFEHWYFIPINDFYIFSSLKIENDNLNLKLVAFNEDLEPMKDVEWVLHSLSFEDPVQSVPIPSSIPATNEEGITETILHPIESINFFGLEIVGMKNNSLAISQTVIYNSSEIFYPREPILSIFPTIFNLEYGLNYYNEGLRGSFFALYNDKLLRNKEINLFLYWSKGIIKVYKTKTNNEGTFHIKHPWPNGYRDINSHQSFLSAVYNNGTSWISTLYPITLFQTRGYQYSPVQVRYSQSQINRSVNTGNLPTIEIKEFNQYNRINLTWEVPSNTSIYSLNFFPQYNSIPLYDYDLIPAFFLGNTPFLNLHSMVKRGGNKVNYIGCIDKDPNLKYLIVEGISYSKANPNDKVYHYWFINPDGTIRDKPKDFPDPPLFTVDVDLTIRIGIFLCVLGAILLVVYRVKRTKL